MVHQVHNFNAGPSALPLVVKQKAKEAIDNFRDTGVSILEVGHRTKEVEGVVAEAEALCLELMGLRAEDYDVVFLQGGATSQFFQVPMNFLSDNATAHYIDTGVWASKALKAAKDFGHVNVIASSSDKNYSYIPKNIAIPNEGAYLHITSNNTIYGTQWSHFPKSNLPIVVDMCSDILSREMDYSQFAFIYAGAQKNAGVAGCTLAVIKKNVFPKVDRKIPQFLQYQAHIDNHSMLNTPPVFAIYVTYLTLLWIKQIGGLSYLDAENKKKAQLMYATIDSLPIFKGTVAHEDRSMMNACFVMPNEHLEKEFLDTCKKNGIYGIKGHRLSGGFRASMYNALTFDSVRYLCDLMTHFAHQKG